ncbi:extracellular solute-binding protein [Streptomyces sp. NPDC054933]
MSRPEPRTLAIVAVCLALVAGAVVVLSSLRPKPSITVLANWSGGNETLFRTYVITPFEEKYGVHVIYQGTTAESQVLKADVEAGTPPDIVVLPGPGELADYARMGKLQPVENLVDQQGYSQGRQTWMSRLDVDGRGPHNYWFPLKTDLKSIVWHPSSVPGNRLSATTTAPRDWCLGMGSDATSGWPATDWIEDILLQQSGWKVYQQWATGQRRWQDQHVEQAWRTWQQMVGAGQNAQTERALQDDYSAASAGVTANPPTCRLEHQASFIRTNAPWKNGKGDFVSSAQLIPHAQQSARTWEVSGDLAAMFRRTTDTADFIRYLASKDTQQIWSLQQHGFSADTNVPVSAYGSDQTTHKLAETLRDATAVHCFDGSDAMPPAMRDAFVQAALTFLARPDTLATQLGTLDAIQRSQPKAAWLQSVCDRT